MNLIPPPSARVRQYAMRIGRVARDVWLVLGVSLALVVGLESGYRTQAALRSALRNPVPNPHFDARHPNAGKEWWARWDDGAGMPQLVYDPYRGYWPLESRSDYVNVDAHGRRHTYDPDSSAGGRSVFLMGGSTMWGYLVRDRYTIPSQVAEILFERGIHDVEVTNLAQSTFNLTQEVVTLLLELRAGRIPDAVVFLDGNNQVAPAFQSGRTGAIINEDLIAARHRDIRKTLWDVLVERSALVARLARAGRSGDQTQFRGTVTQCPQIADEYANLVTTVESLGDSYGFETIFFWQPMLAISQKRMTEWEKDIPVAPQFREMVVQCSALVDQLMVERGASSFISLKNIFDADSTSVFIDHYGHVTESANRIIAERIANTLIDRMEVVR